MEDFGRQPDICLHDSNRVRVTVANPHRAGVTVAELRLVEKVDAVADRYRPAPPEPVAACVAVAVDSHEHPLRA